ncbi:cyclin-dependent protein serine/threonine kinase inhibiting protein FAR1 ASCRUDRAFT_112633 [Ascoidea rubescens DSM 1968]|uniref:RING-type domain-containing protein n=1 Tax=Ascoidea rubescens DSM 1968 TaxID=1344418 RepID=A0A1D2VD72_9ASCO|nr:hypothetical protein ASCRUDRAFT_112633 [Ascoidea rubescens DSM 1968]ODV59443.1 hypothetical protein ASCRUDRAFT_112633 [Ascoidea rubescens DSM 1968]
MRPLSISSGRRSQRSQRSPRSPFSSSKISLLQKDNQSVNSYSSPNSLISPNSLSIHNSPNSPKSPNSFISTSSANSANSFHSLKKKKIFSRQRNSFLADFKCCFCDISLESILPGEENIQLSCSHNCHFKCYLIFMNRNDINNEIQCPSCHKLTKPLKESDHDKLVQLLLTQNPKKYPLTDLNTIGNYHYNNNNEDEDFDCTDYNSFNSYELYNTYSNNDDSTQLSSEISTSPITPTENFTDYQLFFQSSSLNNFTYLDNEESFFQNSGSSNYSSSEIVANDLIDKLNTPIIRVIPEQKKITFRTSSNNYVLPCVFNISMPSINPNSKSNKNNTKNTNEVNQNDKIDEEKIKNKISVQVKKLIKSKLSGKFSVDFQKLGNLKMFDYLNFALIDGTEYLDAQCYLFEKYLLILNNQGNSITGIIQIKSDLSSVIELNENTILLNSTIPTLPEVDVYSEDKRIISKWKNYLKYSSPYIDFKPKDVSLISLTTNAWDIIDQIDSIHHIIPDYIKEINNYKRKGLLLPMHLLLKTLPEPEPLPLRMILGISIFNMDKSLTNQEYKDSVLQLIKTIANSLTPLDKFGIVIIGSNGSNIGKFSERLSSDGSWKNWETYFDEKLVIHDNYDPITKKSYISNSFEELSLYFEKCREIIGTWPECENPNANIVRKFVILNAKYDVASDNSISLKGNKTYHDTQLDNVINKNLKKIIKDNHFTLHSYLIGKEYNVYLVKYFEKLFHFNGIEFGSELKRINTLKDFDIVKIIDECHKICIPNIKIRFKPLIENIIIEKAEFDEFGEKEVEFSIQKNRSILAVDSIREAIREQEIPISSTSNKPSRSIFSEDNLVEFNLKDLTPGYCKNFLFKFNITINNRFKQFYTQLTGNNISVSSTGSPAPYGDIPLINYSSEHYKGNSKPIKVEIKANFIDDITLMQNITSYIPSNKHSDSNNDELTIDTIMNIPVFAPLSASRDIMFAKRQAELTAVRSLRKAIEIYSILKQKAINHNNKISKKDLKKVKGILMQSVSTIFGIIRGCVSTLKEDEEINLSNKEQQTQKYIEGISNNLSKLAKLVESNNELAIVYGYDLLLFLVFQKTE